LNPKEIVSNLEFSDSTMEYMRKFGSKILKVKILELIQFIIEYEERRKTYKINYYP